MASIGKRPDGRWRARYRGPDKRERSKHFDRKVDAEKWLAAMSVSKDRGEWVDPSLSVVRLSEWSQQWLAGQTHLKPSTRTRYASLLATHVVPTFGNVRLSELRHAAVQTWVSGLIDKGLAAATVRQAHRVLSLVLDLAVRDGRLPRNPAHGVKMPKAATPSKRFLSHDQVHVLAEECGPYRTAVLTLAYCGLRFGELAGLRTSDVDLMRRRITVQRAVVDLGGKLILGTPKSHREREVPVPNFLAELLAQELHGRAPDDPAFPSPRGGLLRNYSFRRQWFDAAATAVGVDGLTPHELRHTAASLAIASGASVKVIQRMLGHASAAMTLDVYSHLFADDLDTVADRLNVLGEAAASARADQVRTSGRIVALKAAGKTG